VNELIRFLAENPILAVVIAGIVLQALGGLGARAARKAQSPPRSAPRRPPPRRPAPTPEDIARELRRRLGMEELPGEEARRPPPALEQAPSRPVPRPAAWGEAAREPDAEPARSAPPPVAPVPVQVQIVLTDAEGPRTPLLPESLVAPAAAAAAAPRRVRAAPGARRRRRLLDLRHPAAALVAAEVLGPPRALRGWEGGGPAAWPVSAR
jgi:hypothetical protein